MKKNSLYAKIIAGILAFLMIGSVVAISIIYFLQ